MSQSGSVKWHGVKARAAVRAAEIRGVGLWAEHVLEQANRVVPVQEGTLRLSGAHHGPEVVGGDVCGAVSYSTGADADGQEYAVVQHENLTFQHSAGRTAKYLETPLNASRAIGQAIVAREIKKAL
jgi:hypothetical protein